MYSTSITLAGMRGFCQHLPDVLTLAAAEQTDQKGNDKNATNHWQGDYQDLEVHCRQNQSDNVIQKSQIADLSSR